MICPMCKHEMILNRIDDQRGAWTCEHCGHAAKWYPSRVEEHPTPASALPGMGTLIPGGGGR